MKKLKEKWRNFRKKAKEYLQGTLGEGRKGMYFTTTILSAWLASGLLKSYFPIIPMVCCFLIAAVLVTLFAQLGYLLVRLVFGAKRRSQCYWFVTFALLVVAAMIAAQGTHIGVNLLQAFLFSVGADLLGRSLWSLLVNRKRSIIGILTLALTAMEFGAYAFFLHQEGFGTSPVYTYLDMKENTALEGKSGIDLEKFKASVAGGTYEVETFLYGLSEDADVLSESFNLTSFAERDGIGKIGMDAYFDYELSEVPLAGKVYYPVGKEDCPVLFLVHGNHDYSVDSYLGYDYLGQYLSSYGYVVVSVDENSCNDLADENDGRAVLLLENMKYVLKENAKENSRFYQLIDEENIAIAGHSRGGETVGTAYLFNDYEVYPEDGNIRFDYHFNIKTIIAIAPTVDQYMPTGRAVEIGDVNYFIIQGANDQDVAIAMGEKQYDNIHFSGEGSYIKSMLYVMEANHGQFNELWGKYDLMDPLNGYLNVKGFLAKEEQQKVLEVFTKTFLDVTLLEDRTYQSLFSDYALYQKVLPETVYEQMYQTSDFACLCDFEEDTDLKTATQDGVRIQTNGMSGWTESGRGLGMSENGDNFVLDLEWEDSKEAGVTFQLPAYDMSQFAFSFSIADMDEEMEDFSSLLSGKVILTDEKGNTATAEIGDCAIVYPTWKVQLQKMDTIFGTYEYKHQFQTVIVPNDSYELSSGVFDFGKIRKITINFVGMEKGHVILDQVGFEKQNN